MCNIDIKALAKNLETSGYRIIADGTHTTYARVSNAMKTELASISGKPEIYKNMNGELTFDFDFADD